MKKEQYLQRLTAIESSFRLEGMDPTGLPLYEEARAMILSGKLTPEEALEFVCERTAAVSEPVAVS